MAIVIKDSEVERLALQIAHTDGVSVAEVVREGLLSLAGQRGVNLRRLSLRERLAALASEVDTLPVRTPADTRTGEEILGYNEHGAW